MNTHSIPSEFKVTSVLSEIATKLTSHALALVVALETSEGAQQVVYSGFLLSHDGMEYWITAGHVLHEIRQISQDDRFKIKSAAWLDGHERLGAEARPVDLKSLLLFEIDRKGLDLGFVPLRDYDVIHIESSGKREFLDDADLYVGKREMPDVFFLVGYPHQALGTSGSGDSYTYAVCVPASLQKPDAEAAGDFWDAKCCFWLRALPVEDNFNGVIADYHGMSGCPVFAAYHSSEGFLSYKLVGVQSACSDADPMSLRIVDIQFVAEMIDVVWHTGQLSKRLDQEGVVDQSERKKRLMAEVGAVIAKSRTQIGTTSNV